MNTRLEKFIMKTKFIKITSKIKILQIITILQKILILFHKNKSICNNKIQMRLNNFIYQKYFNSRQIVIKLIITYL